MTNLLSLAERVEQASGPSKALDREVALAYGWVRQSPSEGRRKHPAWFHPSDCRDGKPVLDSLHGTDVWRDPPAYTASLDAAMTLIPERVKEWHAGKGLKTGGQAYLLTGLLPNGHEYVTAATPALALTAACLRALSLSGNQP